MKDRGLSLKGASKIAPEAASKTEGRQDRLSAVRAQLRRPGETGAGPGAMTKRRGGAGKGVCRGPDRHLGNLALCLTGVPRTADGHTVSLGPREAWEPGAAVERGGKCPGIREGGFFPLPNAPGCVNVGTK